METAFSLKNIKAIIGLGNHGSKYANHRHTIGFRILNELAQQFGGIWQISEHMLYTIISVNNQNVYLIKPQTYMNDSGKVLPWLVKKGIKPDQILVVHDELEKNFGKLVFKLNGSHKGHNGLRSIMGIIGEGFWRLKFGIGRPNEQKDVPRYVLSDFTKSEEEQISNLINEAIGLISTN